MSTDQHPAHQWRPDHDDLDRGDAPTAHGGLPRKNRA
jgi:hypothetical protein